MLNCAEQFEVSRLEWCISSMVYSGDTPFWSETLDMQIQKYKTYTYKTSKTACVKTIMLKHPN